ncbi:MAG: cytochrome C class [Chitinophagaceae bacterium]|nr:MAG: cytochrome C class [Chitinophagaceae bacterium]
MKKVILVLVLFFISLNILLQSQPANQGLKTSMERGKLVYNRYCLTCHQPDGGGVPRMNPPLINTEYVLGNKQRLIGIVLKGLNTPLEINEETYENPMASHAFLKDQQIADVLNYVRNSFGNKASIVSPSEVKAVRAKL